MNGISGVRQAIAQNYLNGFFKKHREEVVDVSLTEFNEEELGCREVVHPHEKNGLQAEMDRIRPEICA